MTANEWRQKHHTMRPIALQEAVGRWLATRPVVCKQCGNLKRSAAATGVCADCRLQHHYNVFFGGAGA